MISPTQITTRPRPRGLYVAVWALVVVGLFLLPFSIAVETAMHFSGVAIDGPFQLYNAMRRIEAGFRPGVDFQFFHGLGMAYLHYPLYKLFGGGLAGSEIGRELLSVVVFLCVPLAVFWTFTRDWAKTLALTATFFALSI